MKPAAKPATPKQQCAALVALEGDQSPGAIAITEHPGWEPFFACIASATDKSGKSKTTREMLFIIDRRTGKDVFSESDTSGPSDTDDTWRRISYKIAPLALSPKAVAFRIAVETSTGEGERDTDMETTVRIGRIVAGELDVLIELESKSDYGEVTNSTTEDIEVTKALSRGYYEIVKTTTVRNQQYGGSFDVEEKETRKLLRWNGKGYDATAMTP